MSVTIETATTIDRTVYCSNY